MLWPVVAKVGIFFTKLFVEGRGGGEMRLFNENNLTIKASFRPAKFTRI